MNLKRFAYLYVQYCMAAIVFLCEHHVPNRRLMQHKLHQPQSNQCTAPNLNLQKRKQNKKTMWIKKSEHTIN